jgi:hypothetical protein
MNALSAKMVHLIEITNHPHWNWNVWCGIFGDILMGPFLIDDTLNQAKYHPLLSNEISNFLNEMPLAMLKRILLHQNGAIPHNSCMNVAFLNNHFGDRCIDSNGPIRGPARSPDLNPLDFCLFIRNIRDNVYSIPPGTREELRRRIVQVCQIPPITQYSIEAILSN